MSGYELLRQTGFDERTAQRLADVHSRDVIVRQVEWLALRRASSNRLGLLRRAIEQDWPKPEGMVEDPEQKLGRVFASHYYAAYHGNPGPAATEAFPKDVRVATKFVMRLPENGGEEIAVSRWGRRFGAFMRGKHRTEANPRPNLSLALVLHGDEFLRGLAITGAARQPNAPEKGYAARHAAMRPQYFDYLRLAEQGAQRACPELYGAFLRDRARTRAAMTGGLFEASAATLARFDAEESRLLAFAAFFGNRPEHPVSDWETWAGTQPSPETNPVRYSLPAPT